MGVILKDQKSEDAICLKWQAFSEQKYDKATDSFYDVDVSNATAVSVPARSDIAEKATFSGGESVATWIPKESTYDLYLLAWTSETEEPSIISRKSTWTFDKNAVSQIKNAVSKIKRNSEYKIEEHTYRFRSAYGPESKMLSTSEFNKLVK
jgi:hypothetical protein